MPFLTMLNLWTTTVFSKCQCSDRDKGRFKNGLSMFVGFVFVYGPYCVFCCLQNRNVPQRMHLQDSVDEMKKFNARRKLKVMYMNNHHIDNSLFFFVWDEWFSYG